MLDKKLSKIGSIEFDKDGIRIRDYEAKDAMCREVAILALIHAIGVMQAEMAALIAKPGGTGRTSLD